MSYDHSSPSDRRDQEPDYFCPICGEDMNRGPNAEAFEVAEIICCDDCAEGELATYAEENGQFGVGA